MTKRSAGWLRWGSAMSVAAAVLVCVPEIGWGQAKPNAVALQNATRLHSEAIKHYREGRYDNAIPLAERALIIIEREFGPNNPNVAVVLSALAEFDRARSDYAHAERLLRRALAIRQQALKPEHPDVANSLNNLAALYTTTGDYGRAEPLFLRALAIREKALASNALETANTLDNLAVLFYYEGDYGRAEPLFLRALEIREKALGSDAPDVAISLNNLAELYDAKGDHGRAESLLQRALVIKEKTLPPDHPDVATSLNNLAALYESTGDYARAETLYQRSASIMVNALRKGHPDIATPLHNLAGLYAAKGDYAQAEQFYQRALATLEDALGRNHPHVAAVLNNLAELYSVKGDYAHAEPLYQRAFAILDAAVGPYHPDVARTLNNLAGLHWAQNNPLRAVQELDSGVSIEDRNATREIAVGAHDQRRAYMRQIRGTTESTISLHIQSASHIDSATQLALRTILRRKGLVVDAMANSLANLRERLGPADQEKFDTWRAFNAQYSTLVQRGPNGKSVEEFRTTLKQLDEMRQKLENELSFVSKDLQVQLKPVTIEQVQDALPKDSALVELFRYQPFNPRAKRTEKLWGTPRFVAYVLHPNGHIDYADLGEAKPIENAVEALRDDLARDATDPKPNARRLHQLVMAPIQKLLGTTRRIYLSPDGDLNLVPFDALIDEAGHYLVESFAITYLSSGRDLIRRDHSAACHEAATVFAGPDYEAGKKPETPPDRPFDPLLYAQEESDTISKLMPGTVKREGAKATEAAVKALKSPTFLHISTHGFFAKDEEALHASPDKKIRWFENPLSKSGLAFAGANRSGLDNEDGLLTALEASQLNLWGTKLVVLSACDTGNGDVQNGDGVYGLRRAFAIAGAETVVMSLWQVEGRATTALMKSYYQGLSLGRGRAEALRQGQIGMLHSREHAHPYYWASFIVSGDDRPMDVQSGDGAFCKINQSGGCRACAIGAPEETGAWEWPGVLVVGALAGLRRRGKTTVIASIRF